MNARIITVRFNTNREKHNRAWEALQWLRLEKGYTYSEALAEALISFVEKENGNERTDEAIAKDCGMNRTPDGGDTEADDSGLFHRVHGVGRTTGADSASGR